MADPECARVCSAGITMAFGVLGKRWNGMILGTLGEGPASFSLLRRALGRISDTMLSERLTELSELGLILRTVNDGRPVSVTYALTESGSELVPLLNDLAGWASSHLEITPVPKVPLTSGSPVD